MRRPDDIMLDPLRTYYNWLLDQIDFRSRGHRKYSLLIWWLYRVPFKWLIPMDENRDIDALNMRREFFYSRKLINTSGLWDDERSVLEVLIAFSKRIVEVADEPGEDDPSKWFWIMINNLGLLDFDDIHFDSEKVDEIIERWLVRKFLSNGKFSIFPCQKVTSDQRDVEMWYQMQAYLNENLQF